MLRETWYLLQKDLLLEWRSREILVTMGFFTVLALAVFGLTLQFDRLAIPDLSLSVARQIQRHLFPGILWVTLSFAGSLGMNRTYASEREGRALDGLRIAPIHSEALFLAKTASHFLFTLGCGSLAVPLAALFFDVPLRIFLHLFPILLLGSAGFAILGTFLATLLLHSRLREVLLPLLFLPLALPLIVAGGRATAEFLGAVSWTRLAFWIRMMAIFDLVFLLVALWLFQPTLEE